MFFNLPPHIADSILTVETAADLPTSGIVEGAIRYVEDEDILYTWDGANWSPVGGIVGPTGPGSTTHDAVVRWDATNGTSVANSVVVIDDTGNVSGVSDLTATGDLSGANVAVTGELSGANLDVSGDVESDNVVFAGDVSGVDANFTGTVTGNALNAGGFDGTEEYALYGSTAKFVTESIVTKDELEELSGVTSNVQDQLDAKIDDIGASTDTAIVRWSGTAGDAVQDSGVTIDASDNILTSGDVDAVNITATGTLTGDTLDVSTFNGGLVVVSSGTSVVESGTTDTELGYLSGVTSSIQDQLDDKIDDAEKGANNGVATLDAGGKVPVSQLPSSVITYEGTWAASTNTPTLANGVGDAGMVYIASDAGTVDFGAGNITFAAGDWVIYSGAIWEKSINSNAVVSVNGQTGVVELPVEDLDGSIITTAELNRLDGVTANVQDQLNDKLNDAGTTVVDEAVVLFDGTTGSEVKESVVTISATGAVDNVESINGVTDTEIGYLAGVTSDIQTQLDGKLDVIPSPVNDGIAVFDAGTEQLRDTNVTIDSSGDNLAVPGDISGTNIGATLLTTSDGVELTDLAAGVTPAANSGSNKIINRNGVLWLVDDSGTEFQIGSSAPTGSIIDFAGTAAPGGWLLCFGQTLDADADPQYAPLYSVIGNIYGGSDNTDFVVPDLRGRIIAGKDDMGGSAANRLTNAGSNMTGTSLGATGGLETMLQHSHTIDHGHADTFETGAGSSHSHTINHGHADTFAVGAGGAHSHTVPRATAVPGDVLAGNVKTVNTSSGTVNTNGVGNHTHPLTGAVTSHSGNSGSESSHTHPVTGAVTAHSGSSGNTGTGTGHGNVQPTIILNKIIKL